jgi:hypothetical protein
MGTRKQRQRQEELWYRRDLAEAHGHPFYRRLNEVLDQTGFVDSNDLGRIFLTRPGPSALRAPRCKPRKALPRT